MKKRFLSIAVSVGDVRQGRKHLNFQILKTQQNIKMCSPNKVRCFKCLKWFDKSKQRIEECLKCGDFKCPHCNSCMCNLTEGEKKVALAMIHTYENFMKEEFNLDYDFAKHKEMEEGVN